MHEKAVTCAFNSILFVSFWRQIVPGFVNDYLRSAIVTLEFQLCQVIGILQGTTQNASTCVMKSSTFKRRHHHAWKWMSIPSFVYIFESGIWHIDLANSKHKGYVILWLGVPPFHVSTSNKVILPIVDSMHACQRVTRPTCTRLLEWYCKCSGARIIEGNKGCVSIIFAQVYHNNQSLIPSTHLFGQYFSLG